MLVDNGYHLTPSLAIQILQFRHNISYLYESMDFQ